MSSYATFENYNGNPSEETAPNPYIPIEIQSSQHKKKLLSDYGLVTILVYGKWCGPCTSFKPIFYNFTKENISKCYFAMEDIDLGLSPNVSAVPSLCVYKKGRLSHVIKGGNLTELLTHLPPL